MRTTWTNVGTRAATPTPVAHQILRTSARMAASVVGIATLMHDHCGNGRIRAVRCAQLVVDFWLWSFREVNRLRWTWLLGQRRNWCGRHGSVDNAGGNRQ